jgi:nucleoid-associated protein YgaU
MKRNFEEGAQVSFFSVDALVEHLVAPVRCSEHDFKMRLGTGEEPMKKTTTSSLRMVVAAVAAFVASVSVTACVTSGEADAPATEQVAENATNAADGENVAATTENGAAENSATENAAPAENNSNLSLNGANAAPEAAEGEADPFAAALNNSAQPANNLNSAAPEANSAQTGSSEQGAGSGGELQKLVSESAPGAATTPEGADSEGEDPFAAPTNSALNQAASSSATIPSPSTDDGSVASLPEMGTMMPYYVQKGDTLGDIAATVYGDKSQWRKLAAENNLKDPSSIYAGDVILYTLTEKSKAFAASYEGAALKSVTVAKGDTLSSLAAKVLGSSQEWRTLWKMNAKIANPDSIEVGMVLTYRKIASDTASAAQNDTDDGSEEEVQEASVDSDSVFVGMAE